MRPITWGGGGEETVTVGQGYSVAKRVALYSDDRPASVRCRLGLTYFEVKGRVTPRLAKAAAWWHFLNCLSTMVRLPTADGYFTCAVSSTRIRHAVRPDPREWTLSLGF